MAFKTFTSAVLTATEVNDYLMKQANIVCTSATRPTPVEGMRIYETDTDRELAYDGSNWIIMSEPTQSWTPTFTNTTLGNGTVAGGYKRSDGWIDVTAQFTFGSTSAVTGNVSVSLPIALSTTSGANDATFSCTMFDSSAGAYYLGRCPILTTTSLGVRAVLASGTYASFADTSSTVPFTWATSDTMQIAGRYRLTTRAS